MTPTPMPNYSISAASASSAGRARVPQVKYTYQGPYGTVWVVGMENPEPEAVIPAGKISLDTNTIQTAPCSVTGNTAANLPATTACAPSTAFFDALKTSWPEVIGTARINQPWGHIQVGLVVRNNQLNDGQYLDQSYVGYAGTISGDAHPFSGTPGPLGKDDLGFGFAHGAETGGQIANGVGVRRISEAALFVPGFGFVNPLHKRGVEHDQLPDPEGL